MMLLVTINFKYWIAYILEKQSVSIASSTSFRYFTKETPEQTSYTNSNAVVTYTTDSATGIGSIAELKTFNSGANYYKLLLLTELLVESVQMQLLKFKAIVLEVSRKQKLRNIGFDYPYDRTLKPEVKLPKIFKIDNLAIFDTIGITSYGYGYGSIPPKVIALDGETGTQLEEVDLRFAFGESTSKS